VKSVALQCYTIRDHCKTAKDFAASAKRVKKIGYDTVQISGLGPIPAAEIRSICDGEGLAICATHESGKSIVETPEAVVEQLAALGCKHTAYPYPHAPLKTLDDVKRLSAELTRSGTVLREAGMTLSYHNHQIELRQLEGKTMLDWIYELVPSDVLKAEIDTYWVQFGGSNPSGWLRKLQGRIPLLHLKDYAINDDNQPVFAALGDGNLDLPSVLSTARAGGCEWYIVEQDSGFTDPFVAIERSLRYLQSRKGDFGAS
jgi:sugar phosphate isomerase/epimerase